ncbi:MAG: metalloregulator ArsR/SmtB family transcription factor [Microbacteriaceae bacterium]
MGEYNTQPELQDPAQVQTLDRVFGAVSDPTRREILTRLSRSDERVTDVARNFSMSLNSVSKHIRVLESAGLVRRTVRGRTHVLSLNASPLADAAAWMQHYRTFWTDSLATLDRFVTDTSDAAVSDVAVSDVAAGSDSEVQS